MCALTIFWGCHDFLQLSGKRGEGHKHNDLLVYPLLPLLTSHHAVEVPGHNPVEQSIEEKEQEGVVGWGHAKLRSKGGSNGGREGG